MDAKPVTQMKEAQLFVKQFAQENNWKDSPNIDKFDHLHEELIEMSSHLRYKTPEEMTAYIETHTDVF